MRHDFEKHPAPYHKGVERSRREFLAGAVRAGAALAAPPLFAPSPAKAGEGAVPRDASDLRRLYPDLERHFVFEYYPWYGGPPAFEHWDYLDRHPPLDLSTRYLPRLGAYAMFLGMALSLLAFFQSKKENDKITAVST